ncbi:ABC transporter substrate-binding protein [Streptomyces sp. AC495_CC817]|uniref:ABC transporter substrate-binding protein n=1 Tax=Streptomyces sp. AC495_CC817 TaxID=2823900 RepID=UPI001C26D59F|nr:ABC transporter substrate-binding protein [Streptomyces sp. AC495_CC817]
MRTKIPLAAAAVAATALALTACAGPASPPAGDGDPGTLADGKSFVAVIATDPGTLDPFTTVMSVARGIDRFVYSRLVDVQPDGSFEPGLAEKWEADTTSATFTLREGLTCEDGSELTATDVAANLSYIGDPANNSPLIGLQVQPGTTAVGDDAARTVVVTSGASDAFLLENLGTLAIVCGSVLDDPDARAEGKGATGMFTMTEIVPNSQYTLTRRKDFTWGPKDWDPAQAGLPDTVVFRIVGNETTAANLLLSGEVNSALVIGPDQQRLSDAGLFSADVSLSTGQLIFNQAESRSTADQAVRTALVQALDLAQLRDIVTAGVGTPSTGLTSAAPRPCTADAVSGHIPEFDADAAGATLDKAGWKAGSDGIRAKGGEPLALTLLVPAALGDNGKAAYELAQASWKKVGVDVTLKTVDGPALNESLFVSGDWDISAAPIGANLPSMMVPFYSGATPPNGTNFASVSNDDYAALVSQAATKAGSEGCDDWVAAEQALYDTVTVVPYADIKRQRFGVKSTFAEDDFIVPTSIRMYE